MKYLNVAPVMNLLLMFCYAINI